MQSAGCLQRRVKCSCFKRQVGGFFGEKTRHACVTARIGINSFILSYCIPSARSLFRLENVLRDRLLLSSAAIPAVIFQETLLPGKDRPPCITISAKRESIVISLMSWLNNVLSKIEPHLLIFHMQLLIVQLLRKSTYKVTINPFTAPKRLQILIPSKLSSRTGFQL